jgi:hypothetical protein
MHICDKCNTEFKFLSLLKKHQNRKRSCVSEKEYDEKIKKIDIDINKKINISKNKNKICMFCKETFSTKSNLMKHINNVCKKKKELEENKIKFSENKNRIQEENYKRKIQKQKEEKDDILKENNIMKKLILELLNKQSIQGPQNIINNITNNTQNNLIMINSFGKEDVSHITLPDYKSIFNGFFPGFVKYIEKIHFDESAPQNHNLCLSNMKSKYIYVYENDDWNLKEKNDIIETLINKKYNMLNDKCEELEELKLINKKTIENFEEFCGNYDNKEAQKTNKTNVTLMLYNNRDKIKYKPKQKSNIKLEIPNNKSALIPNNKNLEIEGKVIKKNKIK